MEQRFFVAPSLFVLGIASSAYCADEVTKLLNIILLVVDDMGWSDLATSGNEFHETPEIDKLSKSGM